MGLKVKKLIIILTLILLLSVNPVHATMPLKGNFCVNDRLGFHICGENEPYDEGAVLYPIYKSEYTNITPSYQLIAIVDNGSIDAGEKSMKVYLHFTFHQTFYH